MVSLLFALMIARIPLGFAITTRWPFPRTRSRSGYAAVSAFGTTTVSGPTSAPRTRQPLGSFAKSRHLPDPPSPSSCEVEQNLIDTSTPTTSVRFTPSAAPLTCRCVPPRLCRQAEFLRVSPKPWPSKPVSGRSLNIDECGCEV